jgi:hypothetical protein
MSKYLPLFANLGIPTVFSTLQNIRTQGDMAINRSSVYNTGSLHTSWRKNTQQIRSGPSSDVMMHRPYVAEVSEVSHVSQEHYACTKCVHNHSMQTSTY